MRKNMLLLTMVCFSLICFGQKNKSAPSKEDSIPNYRYEIGTDLLWLINKNDMPRYCLQFKIHNKSIAYPGSFRFRVGVDFSSQDSGAYVFTAKQRSTILYLSSGYQFEKSLNKVKLFYGSDLCFKFNQQYFDSYNSTDVINGSTYLKYIAFVTNVYQFSLVGFVGMSYNINSRMSISLESSLTFAYNRLRSYAYTYYQGQSETRRLGVNSSDLYSIRSTPFSIVNFNINF